MRCKRFLALLAILLIPSSSYAVDRAKLMLLDPLPSARLQKIADISEKSRFLETAVFGISGSWIIGTNIGKGVDAYRINNFLAGSSLLVTSAMNFMGPNGYRSDLKLIDELGGNGQDKEILSYLAIKSKARDSLVVRRTTAFMYILSSLSSLIIAGNSPNLSENERFFTNLNAAGFLCLAAYQVLWPSEVESEAYDMDRELAR